MSHIVLLGGRLGHTRTGDQQVSLSAISFFRVLCPMVFGTFAKTKILQTQLCAAATESNRLGSFTVASYASRDPTLGRAQETDAEPGSYFFQYGGLDLCRQR